MSDDRVDGLITTIVGAVLGLILICSFAIPTVTDQIGNLTADQADQYGSLLGLVLIFMIIGLILYVIRRYNSAGR